MSSEPPLSTRPYWPWLRWMMYKVLPLEFRKETVIAMGRSRLRQAQVPRHAATTVALEYWSQIRAGFNKYAFLAENALVLFCLAAAARGASLSDGATPVSPLAVFIALGAVLCVLTLRDARAYFKGRSGFKRAHGDRNLTPANQYWLDSLTDAVTATVALFMADALATRISQDWVFPAPALLRSALILLPLIPTLRMMCRPKPDFKTPFAESEISSKEIFRRVCQLNILWMACFEGLIVQNVSDAPGSWIDKMRGFAPLITFGMWIIVQRNSLSRRTRVQSAKTDPAVQDLIQMKERLAQGLKLGEPLYWVCVTLELLLFAEMGFALLERVLPWLTSVTPADGFFPVVSAAVAFSVLVLTWQYVKDMNRGAAKAIQAEISRRENAQRLAWGGR